jgi:RimJ/RimL family protein N-acetyltransferase
VEMSVKEVILDPLRPTNLLAYNAIWRKLKQEDRYELRFGNHADPATIGWPWDVFQLGAWRKFVISLDELESIGVAAAAIDFKNAICYIELGILPEFRRQRFGSAAGKLLIRKCFVEYGARRVEASALSTNAASVRMRDWTILEGVIKSRYIIAGQEVDELLYGITRDRWEVMEQRLIVRPESLAGVR